MVTISRGASQTSFPCMAGECSYLEVLDSLRIVFVRVECIHHLLVDDIFCFIVVQS